MLNWIYVDCATHEVKYGVRSVAENHITGPWDVTQIDRRITFEGWEGFAIVEEDEDNDLWGLYFDRDDDGFRRVGVKGRRSLEVEVWRKERRRTKDIDQQERAERFQPQTDAQDSGRDADDNSTVPTYEEEIEE